MLLSCGSSLLMNLQSRADLPRYYRTISYSRLARCCSYSLRCLSLSTYYRLLFLIV